METSILGQDDAIALCNLALESPTHMFFYGSHGSGKTTLARDFLKSYLKLKGIPESDKDTVLYLTADLDRGIHTIRSKITDFVRGARKYENVHRWIVLDDADSLPEVSQQALRRPMEQYAHLTYFIFIAKSPIFLTTALQSRCQPVQLVPVNLSQYANDILEQIEYKIENPDVISWLVSASISSVAEFKRLANLLKWISPGAPTVKDAKQICSTHNYDEIIPLVNAICAGDSKASIDTITGLWQNGMSFEDILHSIHQASDLYFVLPSLGQERLYKFLLTGWSFHAQSRCSFMDLLCCCQDSGVLREVK